jgi:hypothetical protein
MKLKKEAVVDRRIQKTKRALTEALINLILEKGYEKVTIQNIIDRADVGRSTFYIHYESKEQLLLDGHNNLNVKMFYDEKDGDELNFENLFNHIAENHQLAKALLGKKGGSMMTEFLKNSVALKIKKGLVSELSINKYPQKMYAYLCDAAGAAVISLLVSWIEDEMIFTAQEMSVRCQRMVNAIFEKVKV